MTNVKMSNGETLDAIDKRLLVIREQRYKYLNDSSNQCKGWWIHLLIAMTLHPHATKTETTGSFRERELYESRTVFTEILIKKMSNC